MREPIDWNTLFMKMAILVAERSKDPNTQCGCVLVSPDKSRIHYGYNGFAHGIADTEERWQRPQKYARVIHAEQGAVLHSREDLWGWTAYVTMIPCPSCCNVFIQSGIKEIYYLNGPSSTAFDYNLSYSLLGEAGINLSQLTLE